MDLQTDCEISQSKGILDCTSPSFEGPSLNLDHRNAFHTSESDPEFSPGHDEEFYDAVLLCSELDLKKAQSIVDEINEIELEDGIKAKVELYELVHITEIEKFGRLKKVLDTCSYVFVLCTKNFKVDVMNRYIADECVMSSIMNKDKKEPWQVVPVIIQSENVGSLPMGLNSLIPIKWETKFALKKIGMLLKEGTKRNIVRSQSMSGLMSAVSIEETSISGGNGKSSLSSSSGHLPRIALEHEDVTSMATSPPPSSKFDGNKKSSPSSGQFPRCVPMECEDTTSMATSSVSSTKNAFLTDLSTDEGQDTLATSSVSSTKNSSLTDLSTDEGHNSLATSSVPSTKNALPEYQPTDEVQDSLATSSVPSTKNSLDDSNENTNKSWCTIS